MNDINSFEAILKIHLDGCFDSGTPTIAQFNEEADKVRVAYASFYALTNEEFEAVKKRVQEYRAMDITPGVMLVDDDEEHELWYTKRKEDGTCKNDYNNRFKEYLKLKKKWAETAVEKQDKNTDKIMDYLGNPANLYSWARKGLVIGDVQAGKTVNYTSICNKAVDCGYKVIIVLAGVTNTLRKQTQIRLEKDFVGFSKSTAKLKKGEVAPLKKVGVSGFGSVSFKVETFTSEDRDFSKAVADSITGTLDSNSVTPRLFVVKKVKSVLGNLYQWFKNAAESNGETKIDVPMLLIDDESDNASVNTGDDFNPTSINNGIRSIIRLFKRNTYLGITATPFANIFINPYVGQGDELDPDLFPRDFIYSLMAPPEYIGSEKIFGFESEYGERVVEEIVDEEMEGAYVYGHKKTLVVEKLPESMKQAILYFALTNAVRDHLGHTGTHRSMLINVSRFVDVQNQLRDIVYSFFIDIVLSDLENYSKLKYDEAMRYQTIQDLKEIWDEYNLFEVAGCDWKHILKAHLFDSNQNVKVRSINQKSVEKLDYEDNLGGLRVIAVGGNCLSRGLTLEDLVVSYFYRNSQTYDTLMQMGRWFGYRPGYANLVKLWISKDAASWYRHISEATEELKLEIIRMNRNNLKPIDFGLKIKGHPDILIPTTRNKMKNASLDQRFLEVDLAGKLIESPRLRNSPTELIENKILLLDFIKHLDEKGAKEKDELLWRDVDAEHIADLVAKFKSLNWHWYFDVATLSDYISDCGEHWDVSIQQGSGKEIQLDIGCTICPINLQSREVELLNNKINISGTKVRVGKGQCARTGLKPNIAKELADNFKRDFPDKKNVPDSVYLHTDRNPILFIHFLECNDKSSDALKSIEFEITALGLGFVSKTAYDPNFKPQKIKVYLNRIASEIDMSIEEGDDVIVD